MADRPRYDSWPVGVAATLVPALPLLPFLGLFLAGIQTEVFIVPAFGILGLGATQLLWVVPLAFWSSFTGRPRFLVAMLVTASVVFLLNAACFGFVLSTMSVH